MIIDRSRNPKLLLRSGEKKVGEEEEEATKVSLEEEHDHDHELILATSEDEKEVASTNSQEDEASAVEGGEEDERLDLRIFKFSSICQLLVLWDE